MNIKKNVGLIAAFMLLIMSITLPVNAGNVTVTHKVTKVCVVEGVGYRNWYRIHAAEGNKDLNTTSGKIFLSTAPNEKGYLCGLTGKPINPNLSWVHSDPKTGEQYSGQYLRDGVLYIDPNPGATPGCHSGESAAVVGQRGCAR